MQKSGTATREHELTDGDPRLTMFRGDRRSDTTTGPDHCLGCWMRLTRLDAWCNRDKLDRHYSNSVGLWQIQANAWLSPVEIGPLSANMAPNLAVTTTELAELGLCLVDFPETSVEPSTSSGEH